MILLCWVCFERHFCVLTLRRVRSINRVLGAYCPWMCHKLWTLSKPLVCMLWSLWASQYHPRAQLVLWDPPWLLDPCQVESYLILFSWNLARFSFCGTSSDTLLVVSFHPCWHCDSDKPCDIFRKRDDPRDPVIVTMLGGCWDQWVLWGRWIQWDFHKACELHQGRKKERESNHQGVHGYQERHQVRECKRPGDHGTQPRAGLKQDITSQCQQEWKGATKRVSNEVPQKENPARFHEKRIR